MTSRPSRTTEGIIKGLLDGTKSPMDIARAMDLHVETLAAHVSEPTMHRTISELVWLSEVRAQLLISHYRAMAAARLAMFAAEEEPSELTRRACVDLLKLDLDAIESIPVRASSPDDEPASVRAALEQFARGGRDA